MESVALHEQIINIMIVLVFAACRTEPGVAGIQKPDESKLQTGDLIYRLGNGLYSASFKDFSHSDKRFSHAGILVQTDLLAPLCVVHAEADDHSGTGGVRMEPLAQFLHDANDWAVYRLKRDPEVRYNIAERALDYNRQNIPFDVRFDAQDSTMMYCTELVMHCVNQAAACNLIQPRTTYGGKKFIAIDDTYLCKEMELILRNEPGGNAN